ncbi:MAG: hypothetical protein CSYNP_03910 [Syntrophus sp. SKADARSKE-3]|nr:hypothetical protein [Syntrophus sp. SKADARSKE-3]
MFKQITADELNKVIHAAVQKQHPLYVADGPCGRCDLHAPVYPAKGNCGGCDLMLAPQKKE